jgi:hypothetical protein
MIEQSGQSGQSGQFVVDAHGRMGITTNAAQGTLIPVLFAGAHDPVWVDVADLHVLRVVHPDDEDENEEDDAVAVAA